MKGVVVALKPFVPRMKDVIPGAMHVTLRVKPVVPGV